MKTKLFFLSALLLALLGVCGCSGEDEDGLINSQPAVLHYLLIKDAKGMDLLNPGNPSGFKNNEITLEYRTASVHPFIISSEAIVDQRSMQPIYFELRFIAEFSSYVLVLGGFDTSLPFKKEFIIHWPDDTSDSFCAENMYKNQGYDYSLRVNGVKQGNVVELKNDLQMNNNMPMKTKLFFLSALLLAMQGVCGCGGDDDDKTTFQSRWSGCKNESYDTRSGNQLPWDEERVEYEAKDGGRLYLKHVNALFNCATENVEVKVSVNGNHINIVENAIGNMSANCICPSDVECLLSGLSKGKYAISIYRNMISDAHLQFSFSIDYDESLKGDFRK